MYMSVNMNIFFAMANNYYNKIFILTLKYIAGGEPAQNKGNQSLM
jgi:hypothetical protein